MSESILSFFGITIKDTDSTSNATSSGTDASPYSPFSSRKSSRSNSGGKRMTAPAQHSQEQQRSNPRNSSTNKRKRPSSLSQQASSPVDTASPKPDRTRNIRISNVPPNHPLLKLTNQLSTRIRFIQQNSHNLQEMHHFLALIRKDLKEGERLSRNVLRKEVLEYWKQVASDASKILESEQKRRRRKKGHSQQQYSNHDTAVMSSGGQDRFNMQQMQAAIHESNQDLDYELYKERDESIRRIQEDTEDIAFSTRILHGLVREKGEKQQILEHHIENTYENTRSTTKDIKVIEEQDKKYRWSSFFGL